jgi:hypothetical protein
VLIDQLYPSRFLRAADLDGKPLRVTIASLKRDDVGGEQKVVLSFTDGSKDLILNKTNARAIAKALGDETGAWAGKAIVLVPTQVDFRGDMVDANRVRAAVRPSKPAAAAEAADPPFDDDIGEI